MEARALAQVLFAAIGLLIAGSSLVGTIMPLVYWRFPDPVRQDSAFYFGQMLQHGAAFVGGVFIVGLRRPLANWLAPARDLAPGITSESIQIIAFRVVGLYLFANGVGQAAMWVQNVAVIPESVAGPALQAAIGATLVFGARRLSSTFGN